MKVRIYQINGKRDRNHVAFLPYQKLAAVQGTDQIDSQIYDLVFEGMVACGSLDKEEIYRILTCSRPEGYVGRSLSVSDVIELTQDTSGSHFYFCDSVGFREVAFERKADISLLRLLCHPYFIELKALAKHGFVPISRGYAGPGIYYDDRNMTRYGTGSKQYYPAFRCCEWYENCRKRKPSDLAFCYTPYEKILGMETQVIKDEEEWYLQVEIRPDFQCIVLPNGTCWLA